MVQDLFPSPLARACDLSPARPGLCRARRFVCQPRRATAIGPLGDPPAAGVRSDGSLLWELLGRKGLYNSRALMEEISREILYFSAAIRPGPETGINLRENLIAGR